MTLLRSFGWGGIVRVVGAVIFAVIAAIGSGASDTVEIVGGIQLTPAQRVLVAMFFFGMFAAWESYTLRRQLTEHTSSPRLTWSNPKAERYANGAIRLEVMCENTGPTESVAILRGGRAWSGAHKFTIPVGMGSPINSSKIDQMKHRWRVDIDSPANVQFSTGRHDVTWWIVYFDNARPNTHGYLTQVDLAIQFDGVGAGTIIEPSWLDMTSTNEDRFKRYQKQVPKP